MRNSFSTTAILSADAGTKTTSPIVSSSMRTPQIQSVERLSTLIFADPISGDERGLAFWTSGFRHSDLALGAYDSGRPAFRVPEKRTANPYQARAVKRQNDFLT